MGELYSQREIDAIEELQQLANRWPKTLMLFAAGGTLYALRKKLLKEGLNLDESGVMISGISCDGGVGDV